MPPLCLVIVSVHPLSASLAVALAGPGHTWYANDANGSELIGGPAAAGGDAEPGAAGEGAVADGEAAADGEPVASGVTSPVPRCVQPCMPKAKAATPAMVSTVIPRGPSALTQLRSAWAAGGSRPGSSPGMTRSP